MNESIKLTHEDVRLMMHAVGEMRTGLKRRATHLQDCYRNHFAVEVGYARDQRLAELERVGIVRKFRGPDAVSPYNYYCVTEKGWRYLLAHRTPRPAKSRGGVEYYILDKRSCVGNCALWWCPDRSGYTCDLNEAGLYTLEDAASNRETDIPIHRDDAQALVVAHVRLDSEHGAALIKHGRRLHREHRRRVLNG